MKGFVGVWKLGMRKVMVLFRSYSFYFEINLRVMWKFWNLKGWCIITYMKSQLRCIL